MVSAAPAPTRGFYGPVSPAILGFDWEEEEEAVAEEVVNAEGSGSRHEGEVEDRHSQPQQQQQQQQPSQQRLQRQTQPQQQQNQQSTSVPHSLRSVVLDFWGFNAALLQDFLDDAASEGSGMATDGGSVVGDNVPPPLRTDLATSTIRGRENLDPDVERWQGVREAGPRRDASTNRSESGRSNNPYAAAIEDKHNAMTVAFLRSPAGTGPTDGPSALDPDDLGFGQRYKMAAETDTVVITNQRRLPDVLSGDRDCIICTDTKPVSDFPSVGITKGCTHEPTTCLVCVATSIRTDLSSRLWNEIKCPECRETLEYDDVQRFADDETKERYQTLSFRSAISSSPTFLWCTAGCGYGQVHEGGASSPIVTCRLCGARSCFHHKVAWHENLACDEYDSLLADPANFRSRFDMDNEEAEQAAAARRAQEDADRVFAQGLVAAEQRVVAEERAERERRQQREEAERRERAERERRERAEKEKRERAEREMRESVLRRKREEEASSRTVGTTTKPCPGCRAPIEKNDGW